MTEIKNLVHLISPGVDEGFAVLLNNKMAYEITESDLLDLVESGQAEGTAVDFKEDLDGTFDPQERRYRFNDGQIRELLADITSFANTDGGYLVYGMKEAEQVAIELCGIPDCNKDILLGQFEKFIQSSVKPPTFPRTMDLVPLSTGRHAFVIQISRSYSGPHMVDFRGSTRFFARNSAGKYLLERDQIGAAFLRSATLPDMVRRFRGERLNLIESDGGPLVMGTNPKLVFHLVPFDAFSMKEQLQPTRMRENNDALRPYYDGNGARYNLDGFVRYSRLERAAAYTQMFRNGCVEAVATLNSPDSGGKWLHVSDIESRLISLAKRYLGHQKALGMQPPVVLMVSVLGVAGFNVFPSRALNLTIDPHPIDRNDLLLPEVIIEQFDVEIARDLRSVFDAMWNAGGYPKSYNYDESGNWNV